MQPQHSAHSALAAGTVYGPVPSRRYGVTLGINLLPLGAKRCTYRCTYCQLGPEHDHRRAQAWPDAGALRRDLTAALQQRPRLDGLVISGNGEPTLHPQLPEMIRTLAELRDTWLAGTPIVLLTAGTELHRPEVAAALQAVDEVAVKLDAGTQQTFEQLDMSWQNVQLDALTQTLAQWRGLTVQTMLVQGRVDNTTGVEIAAWLERIRFIAPARVDLYTLDRRPIDRALAPVPLAVAQRIRDQVIALGVPCRIFAAQ